MNTEYYNYSQIWVMEAVGMKNINREGEGGSGSCRWKTEIEVNCVDA